MSGWNGGAHSVPMATCDGCGGIVRLSELDTWDGQRLCEACYPPECDCPSGSPCKDDRYGGAR